MSKNHITTLSLLSLCLLAGCATPEHKYIDELDPKYITPDTKADVEDFILAHSKDISAFDKPIDFAYLKDVKVPEDINQKYKYTYLLWVHIGFHDSAVMCWPFYIWLDTEKEGTSKKGYSRGLEISDKYWEQHSPSGDFNSISCVVWEAQNRKLSVPKKAKKQSDSSEANPTKEQPGFIETVAKTVLKKVAGSGPDLFLGCNAYYAKHKKWPTTLVQVKEILKEAGRSAKSFDEIQEIEFHIQTDGSLNIKYKTPGIETELNLKQGKDMVK